MDNDDWDIFSIVRSCNATSFTTPTTTFETPHPPEIQTTNTITSNNIISCPNTTPSFFNDFTFTQENRSVPFAPLKPTDFIELDKLMIKLNPTTTTIPIPTTTSIPTIITTSTSSPVTIIPSANTIPTHITNIIAPTTTTPTNISPITTTTTSTTPTTIGITSKTTTNIIPTITTIMTNTSVQETNQYPSSYPFPMLIEQQQQQIQTNNNNQVFVHEPVACIEITTAHFDRAYNHPSIPKQPPREFNRPPIILPQTSSRVLPNTQTQQTNCETRKRKNNNQMVCYVTEDKLSEDSWAWKKYGQKLIKGSPHPRNYYRCSTFTDCLARKRVEKSKTKENIYIVTYKGEHNHKKPEVGTSHSKPSNTRLPTDREAKSSTNIEKGLRESQLLVTVEDGSSLNVGNFDSNSMMTMIQFDEPESSNAQVFPGESKIPYSETRFIGSSNEDDNILMPNITAMSEDLLLDFNRLNNGVLFP